MAVSFRLPMGTRYRDRCAHGKKYFARRLRKAMTPAERMLWERVRRSALGPRFRRQHLILGWIADFYCPAAALVVEVDGGYHTTRRDEDARRDAEMNKLGIRVLRFPNELVELNLDGVVRAISEVLKQRGAA